MRVTNEADDLRREKTRFYAGSHRGRAGDNRSVYVVVSALSMRQIPIASPRNMPQVHGDATEEITLHMRAMRLPHGDESNRHIATPKNHVRGHDATTNDSPATCLFSATFAQHICVAKQKKPLLAKGKLIA